MSPAAWLFLAWAVASLGWAIDPSVAWGELTTLLQLFLIALLVADLVSQRPDMVRQIMWVYSISAAATACVGIVSFLGYGPTSDIRAAALQDQNPAQFAAVLLPALIFGLFEALDGQRRLAGAGIALVTSVAVIVSGTRGAWVSIAVVVRDLHPSSSLFPTPARGGRHDGFDRHRGAADPWRCEPDLRSGGDCCRQRRGRSHGHLDGRGLDLRVRASPRSRICKLSRRLYQRGRACFGRQLGPRR